MTTMTIVAITVAVAVAFVGGFAAGMYYTTKVMTEGKVKNVKVTYTG